MTKINKVDGSDNLALPLQTNDNIFHFILFKKKNYRFDINCYLCPNCCVDDDAKVEANMRNNFSHKDKVEVKVMRNNY